MSLQELKKLSVKSDDKKSKGSMEQMLSWNSLVYSLPMTGSLVVKRNMVAYNFDSTSYDVGNSGQMSVTFNTGEMYVNVANSYLEFTCNVNWTEENPAQWTFGIGSALNCWSSSVVNSKTGGVISRNEANNVFQAQENKAKQSAEWFATVGHLMGYGTTFDKNEPVKFIVPLRYINSLFDSQMLCPDTILGGARLTLQFERLASILSIGDVSGVSMTITSPKLICDTHILSEASYKSLALSGAKHGLEYVFRGIHHESQPVTTSLNTSVSKSVARCLECVLVPRLDASINSYEEDSMRTPEDIEWDHLQLQLGAHLFPNSRAEGNVSIYANNLYSLDQISDIDKRGAFLTYADFEENGYGSAHITIQTQSLLQFSGTSVNSSRVIRVNSALVTGGSKTLDIFITYMAVVRAFRTNLTVTS